MLERKVTLIPQSLQILFKDNVLSIHFKAKDDALGVIIPGSGEYVNFQPSKKLMETLKVEMEEAIVTQSKFLDYGR